MRDVRDNVTLPSGIFNLKFMDIAASVNPATVHFRSLTDPDKLSVLEQNYEYDLLEPAKLLAKYVGREVTLVRTWPRKRRNQARRRESHAAGRQQRPGLEDRQRYRHRLYAESYPLSRKCPPISTTIPRCCGRSKIPARASQKSKPPIWPAKLSWNADYVLTISREDKAADLDGWVTLANHSGTAFQNARLQLVAGELNRVPRQAQCNGDRGDGSWKPTQQLRPAFQQETFSEYHLYTLGRRTSMMNNETKQISLLQGTGIPTRKNLS